MNVKRYLSNKEKIGLTIDGFLIGDLSHIKNDSGESYFDYSLDNYSQITDIVENKFSIIIGSGGLGKTTLLKQIEDYLNDENQLYKRIDLRTLINENSLNEQLFKFLQDKDCKKEIYLLLDAIDEAIDHNIRNPIEVITQTVKNVVESYPNSKFIITSRTTVDNIGNLAENLTKIYSIETNFSNFIYKLCPLTINNIKELAINYKVSDTDKFIEDIKNYNLTSFLTSPITFKSVADLYKKGKISSITTHFDIYLELVTDLCRESSEYRRQQSNDNIDKYKTYHPEKLLLIASKLAMDLKLRNKNSISEERNNTSIFINDYFEVSFKDINNIIHKFYPEEVKATLMSNLFYKVDKKYYFSQKTYIDFLCAYHLSKIGIDTKHFNKFFIFENKVHPNYYEILSLLCLKYEKFFEYYKNKSPEALIFSQVLFNKQNYNKTLFKKYLTMVNTISYYQHNINKLDICKKLYYINSTDDIRKNFKSKNEDVLMTAIDFIYVNKIEGLDKELENIIFDNKYSNRLKMNVMLIVRDIVTYENLAQKIYNHICIIEKYLEQNDSNDLRSVFLEVMYPKYFDDDKLLSYIVQDDNSNYFGWYHYYIKNEFLNEKYINSNNYLKMFKWVISNNLKGVTESPYGSNEFPENIKKFFTTITKYINDKNLIDEIMFYQINNYERNYSFFSNDLFKTIVSNNKVRLYALKKYINLSKENYHYWSLSKIGLLQSRDLAYLLVLYNNEKDKELKDKYKKAINSFYPIEYWNNEEIKDFEYLYNIFKHYPKLKLEFPIISKRKCRINPLTLQPSEKIFRDDKYYYLKNIREEKKEKKEEENTKIKLEYHSNITARINENIENYENIKHKKYLENIFAYLTYNRNDELIYYEQFLDFKTTKNWQILNDKIKNKIISICFEYLKDAEPFVLHTNLDEFINRGYSEIIWNSLGCLEFYKNHIDNEQYIDILDKHKLAILYFKAYKDDDKLLQQKFIQDLCKRNKSWIEQQISNFVKLKFNYYSHYTDLYKKFTLCNEYFIGYLESILKNNNKELPEISIIALVNYLIKNNSEYAIKYCINTLKENINNNKFVENNILVSFLSSILSTLDYSYWKILSKIFYKNKYGVEIFKKVSNRFDYYNSFAGVPLEKFCDKDLVKLYIWIKKNIRPEKNSEIVHNYNPEDNVSNTIYQFFINNGKYKCIEGIRKTMSPSIYKRSYNIALNNYIQMKVIDIQAFNNFAIRKKNLIITFIDNSINVGNINNSIINNIGHKYWR